MNLSLLPLSLTAAIPAFVLIGLGAAPALGLIIIMGTFAMLMRDYHSELAYQRELSPVRPQQQLALAA